MNLIAKFLFFSFTQYGIFMSAALALDCLDKEEKSRNIKSICFLEESNTRIELHYTLKGCEFPEGNLQDCAYVSACQSDKSYTQKGRQVYRKGIALESFCTSAKNYSINGKKVLASLSGASSNRRAKAYFMCPHSKHKSILLTIGTKQKKCQLPF